MSFQETQYENMGRIQQARIRIAGETKSFSFNDERRKLVGPPVVAGGPIIYGLISSPLKHDRGKGISQFFTWSKA